MKMNKFQLASILDQARSLVEEKKPLHAAQLYLRLIYNESSFLVAYIELSALYAELGQFSAALAILKKADQRNPNNVEIIFLLGNLHLRVDAYDKALGYFKLLVDKKFPQVHFNMGMAYFYQNKIKQAEEQFRLTLKYDPKFPKVNESLGELMIKKQAYTEAIEYLKRGIDLDPYSSINHHLLGVAYSKIYDWKNAYNEFVVAIEMDPNESSNWYPCGEMLMHLKRLDEAEQYVRKAISLVPLSVDALLALSEILLVKGDTASGVEYLNHALRLDPTNEHARGVQWKIRHLGGDNTKKERNSK
jgi:tetratricopeptide (TPR) repeat protein